jgi:hypothetical protein
MTEACHAEIVQRGKVPAFQTICVAQEATVSIGWVRQGDAKVREVCPGVLDRYTRFIEASLHLACSLRLPNQHKEEH